MQPGENDVEILSEKFNTGGFNGKLKSNQTKSILETYVLFRDHILQLRSSLPVVTFQVNPNKSQFHFTPLRCRHFGITDISGIVNSWEVTQ